MTQPTYFSILARNYLPKALALSESLRNHGDGAELTLLVIDANGETELPEVPGVRWMHPGMLGLDERTVLELAMSYDLVEFATAIKPLAFRSLLREHEQVVYLDPDTYVVSPMEEISPALTASAGIVLTPHRLGPATADGPFPDGHLLHAGVYNLGFCAVDRRAGDFLDWWWGHLRTECLYDPGAGLYLDQRWVDVGSVYFNASALRHYGYNASLTNLPERRVVRDADGYYIDGTEDRLRLFHFHSFDPRRPKELSIRFSTLQPEGFRTSDLSGGSEALISLCEHYATAVLEKERELGPQPPYIYESDTTGRPITPRTRRVYGVAALADPGGVPSPFIPAEAAEYEQWRRASRPLTGRLMLSDVAKGFRSALPQEYQNLKRRFPRLTASLRGRFIKKRGMW